MVDIAEGRIRASGDREELRDQHSRPLTELQIAGDGGWVRDVPGVEVVEFDGGYVLFEAEEEARQRVLAEAVSRGSVTGFTRRRPTLSEIFQEVVQ